MVTAHGTLVMTGRTLDHLVDGFDPISVSLNPLFSFFIFNSVGNVEDIIHGT